MILQGDLRDFSLPDVLQLMSQQRKTGVLTVTQGKMKSAEIFISQGNINGVRVESRTPETKIQEMLIESGRMSVKEMADLESISKDMGRPLLSTLAAKGLLAEDQRELWFQMGAEDMVCDLFAWTEGQYAFSTTQKSLPHALGNFSISTEFACMEGMRRIDEWPHLKEKLPSAEMIFQNLHVPPTKEMGEWEQMVLEAIDGKRNLVRLIRLVPFGQFRLYECINNLWKSGAIAPLDSEITPSETLQPLAQSEKDQKTSLVIGIAAGCLILAGAFRFFITLVLDQTPSQTQSTLTRVQGNLARRNAEVFLLQDGSEQGKFAEHLSDLVRRDYLSVVEAFGPEDARLNYQRSSPDQFEFR